jgi:protoheme ferro-lyase
MENLAFDFYRPIPHSEKYVLAVTDTYSKFPEVEIVKSTSAKACIPKLDCIFSTHGIPKKIKTDNGPPFNENEFKRHMAALGIECELDKYSTLWPQGNGNAESVMKPLEKVIKTSMLQERIGDTNLKDFY